VTKKLDSSDRTIDSKQVGESSVVKETETVKNNNKSAVQSNSKNNSISAPVVCHQCPLCTRTFNNLEQKERHVSKCAQSQNVDPKTLSAAEEMQERQMAERLSLGLPPVAPALNKTKSSRRRAIDPLSADLSLAIALSESLQSAAESERRKEEEMLLAVIFFFLKYNMSRFFSLLFLILIFRKTWLKSYLICAKKMESLVDWPTYFKGRLTFLLQVLLSSLESSANLNRGVKRIRIKTTFWQFARTQNASV